MKVIKAMTIDHDIYEQFQRLFPNQASSFCNEQMRIRIASAQGDLTGIDIELLKVQERESMTEVDIANTKLIGIREKLNLLTDQAKDKEKARILEEKERLEALHTCNGCGGQMLKHHVEAGGEQFCKECFLNEHPKLIEALKRDRE